MAYIKNVHVLSHLKEELTWAIDKWLWVTSNTNDIKNSITPKNLKNKAVLNLKKYCMHCYMTLSNIF